MKIYQKHTVIEIQVNQVAHLYTYTLAENSCEACFSTINDFCETYAVEVSKQTLLDEITHCEALVKYWKTEKLITHRDIIIERQMNLIKEYKEMLEKCN